MKPQTPSKGDNIKISAFICAIMLVVIFIVSYLLNVQIKPDHTASPSDTFASVIVGAQDTIRQHYPDGDYSALDNETFHRVAFPESDYYNNSVFVEKIGSSLYAFPANEGKSFSIVVDSYLGGDVLCNLMIESFPNAQIEISGVPLNQLPEPKCTKAYRHFKITAQ